MPSRQNQTHICTTRDIKARLEAFKHPEDSWDALFERALIHLEQKETKNLTGEIKRQEIKQQKPLNALTKAEPKHQKPFNTLTKEPSFLVKLPNGL